jgi:hypothetical protein
METEIAENLGRSDLSAYIVTQIEKAIEFYQSHRFTFNETLSITLTTADGTEAYSTVGGPITDASDIMLIDDMYRIDGSAKVKLSRLTHESFQDRRRISTYTTGFPYSYYFLDGEVYLYPIPNGTYNIEIAGIYRAAKPASSGEANNLWMTKAYSLIMHKATSYIYAKRIRNFDLASVEDKLARDEYLRLRGEADKKTATGNIESTRF